MPDTTPPGEASIKALVAAAVADLQRLVKAQIALAKLELQQTGRAAGKTGIFLVSALSMAALGGIFLLVTLAYVLVALGLPVWAGFGIVTLVLFIAAAILGLLGFAQTRLNHDSHVRRYLTEAIFAYYIAHQTIIVAAGFWL